MQLEFHQLDRRLEHLRVHRPERHRRLLASLAANGQQTPIIVVASEHPEHYLVIDGYQRIAALAQLGRDTVEAVVWSLSESEALLLDRSMRAGEQATALEEGWLLVELEQRFGYDQEDLSRRFDRSTSWVSRRMGLVELLPMSVQQQVRSGAITAHVAMKYLVPVARMNLEDCCRMAEGFARHRLRSREERCCMDRAKVELPLFPSGLRGYFHLSDGVRASSVQHSIEDGHADRRLGLLSREASRSQARTEDALVSAHCSFNQSTLAVVGLLLPAKPSLCRNGNNVLVPLRRIVSSLGAEHRCHVGRNNHIDIFAMASHHIVGRHPIISAVGGNTGDCRIYLTKQRCHLRRVSNIVAGQRRGQDHSGVGIHCQV